ncbi:MAG: lipoate--protein ligase family protein [Bacteroidetes bacterium]|nr:MAG: lipoate--protein ligase family protein [Bacteroidota bacterium]
MCLGYFQDSEEELDMEYCDRHNLQVIRREQGGGAVYIDSNQLFVQWIFHPDKLPLNVAQRFRLFTEPIIETYKKLGVQAYFYPVNDVHVNGKKIVGTGAARIGEAEVVTGNFLFDFDFEAMIKALKVPDEGFRNDFAESLRDYLTTINIELEDPPAEEVVKETYVTVCEKVLGRKLVPGEFTDKEIQKMKSLDQKMQSTEWLYQYRKPGKNTRMVKVHAGVYVGTGTYPNISGQGSLRVRMNGNRIERLSIKRTSDFSKKFGPKLEEILTGALLEHEDLSERTSVLNLNNPEEEEIKHILEEIIEISRRKPGT